MDVLTIAGAVAVAVALALVLYWLLLRRSSKRILAQADRKSVV